MAALAPLKRLGRGLAYWAAGDFLGLASGGTGATTAAGAVSNLLGYQPARPVTAFSASSTNVAVSANSSNAGLLQVSFVATATTAHFTGYANVKSPSGGATEFTMFPQLYDTTAGVLVKNDAQSGCYINTSATNGGNVAVALTATGLTVGHSYTATLFGGATSAAVNVNAISMGGANL